MPSNTLYKITVKNSAEDETFTDIEMTWEQFLFLTAICEALNVNKPAYAPTLTVEQCPDAPDWMTPEQVRAAVEVYKRNPNAYTSMRAFFATVQNYGDYAGLLWSGMFLGIEKDGYTHS